MKIIASVFFLWSLSSFAEVFNYTSSSFFSDELESKLLQETCEYMIRDCYPKVAEAYGLKLKNFQCKKSGLGHKIVGTVETAEDFNPRCEKIHLLKFTTYASAAGTFGQVYFPENTFYTGSYLLVEMENFLDLLNIPNDLTMLKDGESNILINDPSWWDCW